tara:strand:+ start:87 stop:251 length:165 start_codon:yes stop_codon:yes gene_type:complete
MAANPRRISKIEVVFSFPKKYDDKVMKVLENAARTCPVFYSLHPDMEKEIRFIW